MNEVIIKILASQSLMEKLNQNKEEQKQQAHISMTQEGVLNYVPTSKETMGAIVTQLSQPQSDVLVGSSDIEKDASTNHTTNFNLNEITLYNNTKEIKDVSKLFIPVFKYRNSL